MKLSIAKVASKLRWQVAAPVFAVVFTAAGAGVYAATSEFSQVIDEGALEVAVLDNNKDPVTTPSFALPTQDFSFDCQTSTATNGFGTDTQRIYVLNPSVSANWTLTIAASDPSDEWVGDATAANMSFNDPAGSGCDNGQMTIDPSAGTLNDDCLTCDSTGTVSLGSSQSFSDGVTDEITLLNAASADVVWRGYLKDATISQKIPAETQADAFAIDLILTATAN